MNKNQMVKDTKHFINKNGRQFNHWFKKKDHPRSILNKKVFFIDLFKFIALLMVLLIVHANIETINKYVLVIIKIGSLIQLVLLYFILKKLLHLILNLKYAIRGWNHGTKTIAAIVILVVLMSILFNQAAFMGKTSNVVDQLDVSSFNPLKSGVNLSRINISSIKLPDIKNALNSCPQIDVPMKKPNSYSDLTIKGQTYDGWTVKGDATCRKGKREGENVNYYYCGGYTSFFGIGSVNAYIEKTPISESGDIGKTTKHVIWNVYNEHKDFVETRCLGDPDDFDRKQAEAFEREMLKWN